MSKLQELIKELCPDGVEFRKLGEVCEITIGEFVHKNKQIEDGKYPVYNGGRENTGFYESYNNIGNKVIISARGANAGYVNKVLTNYWAGNSCYSLFPLDVQYLNWFFLYYVLKSKEKELMGNQQTGSIPALSKKQIEQIEIPLPPLEVQNEIVRILDTFTSHAAELQAELQARKEQYEYYRNKLLTFDKNDEGVKWMKLGEIGNFVRGNGLQKKDFTETGVGCIHYGQIYTYYGTSTDTTKSFVSYDLAQKLTKVKSGNLVIACTSENIEDVCKAVVWLGEEDIVTGGHACVFAHNEIPKYIAYFFQTEYFFQQKKKYARGAKVIDIKVSDLEKISIPIPPLSEQQRIVSILDKFESFVNDLTAGLPAEIAAVQEQYEYYRNKLLTFKRIS